MFHTCGTFRGTFYIVHYITNTLWNILMFYNRGTSWNIRRWWFFLPVVVIPGAASPANLRPGTGPDQKKCNIFVKSL